MALTVKVRFGALMEILYLQIATMKFTEKNRQELAENGYTVVEDVITESECEDYIHSYREWLSDFPEGDWPFTSHSLIQRYSIGHHDATWHARLKTKAVFSELWKTDKLLTSVDAIAIGRPPEEGEEDFASEGRHWLHADQGSERIGLHAYQGALYLEAVDEDDWTFHLMEKSHLYLDKLYDRSLKAALKSAINKYYHLRDDDQEWFVSQGCRSRRVAVPRGGMVLWDSRLIHANARPKEGRTHPDRWRFCVMVCMTPASWATPEDLANKAASYKDVTMTTHWPSQGVMAMPARIPSYCPQDIGWIMKLPEIAKSEEVKKLCGVIKYDFKDGKPNGPEWRPVWKMDRFRKTPEGKHTPSGNSRWRTVVVTTGLAVLAGLLAWTVM